MFLEDAGFDWKILGPDVSNEAYIEWQCDQDAYACSGQKCSAQSVLFMHSNWAQAGETASQMYVACGLDCLYMAICPRHRASHAFGSPALSCRVLLVARVTISVTVRTPCGVLARACLTMASTSKQQTAFLPPGPNSRHQWRCTPREVSEGTGWVVRAGGPQHRHSIILSISVIGSRDVHVQDWKSG